MNDDRIDRALAQLANAELPLAPLNLEADVLRTIRTAKSNDAAQPAWLAWWGLPQLGAALAITALLVGFVGGTISASRGESAKSFETALHLDVFGPQAAAGDLPTLFNNQ